VNSASPEELQAILDLLFSTTFCISLCKIEDSSNPFPVGRAEVMAVVGLQMKSGITLTVEGVRKLGNWWKNARGSKQQS